jgi:glucose/arabinose dehydrogenase
MPALWLVLICLPIFAPPASAELSDVSLQALAAGLENPLGIVNAGDERLFVVLQDGRIVIFEDGEVAAEPFLDLRDRVLSAHNEQGLLGAAFHPDYADNGFFFVSYTGLDGDTVIGRFRVSSDPGLADPASETVVLEIEQLSPAHNGGQLQFGPDGYLYLSTGDSGPPFDPRCKAQDGTSLLGKILRIDVDQNVDQAPFHGVPADNPFVGVENVRDEIWALGLRNPWRFSFDRATGDLFVGDVGQDSREEIDFEPAGGGGRNFGWKLMEGTLCLGNPAGCSGPLPACDAPEYTPPILEFPHEGGLCAVIAGFVYRGTQVPDLAGRFVYGDLCTGTLWAAESVEGVWQAQQLTPKPRRLTSFGEDVDGELYLVSGDFLYRVVAQPPAMPGVLELTTPSFSTQERAGEVVLTVSRSLGSDGEVRVDFTTADGTALAGEDYLAASGTLTWGDGDTAPRSFPVAVLDDSLEEDDEALTVTLSSPGGGAILGVRESIEIEIVDDDGPGSCMPGPTTLCLNRGRFRAEASWRTRENDTGLGQAVTLSADAGYFWFFNAANPEIFIKVLEACYPPFNHYWVFAAGLTDVETSLTVVDTATGELKRYDKAQGLPFEPILDTTAFATCP